MAVLVIDDSRAMQSMLKGILRGCGFQVVVAGDGREALECLKRGDDIEAMLVDWHMPRMDGCDFIRAVRAFEAYRDLPVMMVTAESEVEQVNRALAAGADEYVMKPFTREAVLEKLNLLGIAPN
ncbi:MAG: response regulator [Candidatus Competibacter sp.]|nr:response regulator [Candidatus Competibacter sp.]